MRTKSNSSKAVEPAKARPPKPNIAAECPVRPLIKTMSALLRIEEATHDDKCPHTPEVIKFSIVDKVQVVREYAASLRATSLEGGFFQL